MDILLDLLLGKMFGHLMSRWPATRLVANALAIVLGAGFAGLVLGIIAARLWGEGSALFAFWAGFALAGAGFLLGAKEKWGRFRDPTLS